ncbi:hypothetical protein B932_1677 [Gluconobacter oxydans H24]|nr:hypothetical protein B932_1677 [Gluconobacter oxydans H24]
MGFYIRSPWNLFRNSDSRKTDHPPGQNAGNPTLSFLLSGPLYSSVLSGHVCTKPCACAAEQARKHGSRPKQA